MSISDNSAESRQLGEFVKMDLSRKKKDNSSRFADPE